MNYRERTIKHSIHPQPTGLSSTLRKELNLFDTSSIVVGTMIGSGIFLLPSFIAMELGSLWAVLAVWIVGGLVTVFGALSLAELGSIYPAAGGVCTYLRNIYGSLPAFLYAWALLLIIHSGSIAALGAAFARYAAQLASLTSIEQKFLSAAFILCLTVVNCLGIRGGKLLQNVVAISKIGGIVGLICILFNRSQKSTELFEAFADPKSHSFHFAGFGIALVAVLWAYEGWHVVSFVTGEMKEPEKSLPRGLLFGTTAVLLIYLVANVGYYHLLSVTAIQSSNALAATAAEVVLGPPGARVISILIIVSILGATNGMVLSGPRVYYVMGEVGIFPSCLGKLSPRYRTPLVALGVQGIWAAALAFCGTYEQLFTHVIFSAWIFYGLAVAGVIVLRCKNPELKRPFCVPGYPLTPLLFCAAAGGLAVNTIIGRPRSALIGLTMLASGVPVYYGLLRWGRKHTSPSEPLPELPLA